MRIAMSGDTRMEARGGARSGFSSLVRLNSYESRVDTRLDLVTTLQAISVCFERHESAIYGGEMRTSGGI